jgi:hypothetical protein
MSNLLAVSQALENAASSSHAKGSFLHVLSHWPKGKTFLARQRAFVANHRSAEPKLVALTEWVQRVKAIRGHLSLTSSIPDAIDELVAKCAGSSIIVLDKIKTVHHAGLVEELCGIWAMCVSEFSIFISDFMEFRFGTEVEAWSSSPRLEMTEVLESTFAAFVNLEGSASSLVEVQKKYAVCASQCIEIMKRIPVYKGVPEVMAETLAKLISNDMTRVFVVTSEMQGALGDNLIETISRAFSQLKCADENEAAMDYLRKLSTQKVMPVYELLVDKMKVNLDCFSTSWLVDTCQEHLWNEGFLAVEEIFQDVVNFVGSGCDEVACRHDERYTISCLPSHRTQEHEELPERIKAQTRFQV